MTLWDYYVALGKRISQGALAQVTTLPQWQARRPELHREFLKSLGLDPLPPRCDLKLRQTGRLSGSGYTVTKLGYQILPDCWASALLYLPEPLPAGRLPGVLYACGHSLIGGGYYQPHAMVWARRGYACLMFDTIEQNDNPGDHHALYFGRRPDLVSMGYIAAGGELWNSIRALDVLAAQPMVDPDRLGVTGNSGGGSLSFLLAAADQRIRVAAPGCGIPSIGYTLEHRHLQDHCDCMYFYNPYMLDASDVAALIAPRPLLFCFASQDMLFSPAEYHGLFDRTRRIYALLGSQDHCALCEQPGPHGYRPDTVRAINRWFDQHLAGQPRPDPDMVTGKAEIPEKELSVYHGEPPQPNHLDILPELLCPPPAVGLPRGAEDWPNLRRQTLDRLQTQVFHPLDRLADEPMQWQRLGSWIEGTSSLTRYGGSIGGMGVWMEMVSPAQPREAAVIGITSPEETGPQVLKRLNVNVSGSVLAAIEPRGTGMTAPSKTLSVSLLRAGAFTGITPVMLLIQDLRRILPQMMTMPELAGKKLFLYGHGEAAVAALYYALFDERIAGVVLDDLFNSHREGGQILNILRVCDLPQALGLMGPRPVGLLDPRPRQRLWAQRLYERIGANGQLTVSRGSLRHLVERTIGTENRDEK